MSFPHFDAFLLRNKKTNPLKIYSLIFLDELIEFFIPNEIIFARNFLHKLRYIDAKFNNIKHV